MDYVIFNSNGSVNKKHIYGYIQQDNDGVDQIFITYPGVLDSDTAQAVFTLPNQDQNTLAGIWQEQFEYDPDEEPSDGFLFTLTERQTRYFGTLIVAIRLIRSNTILVNFPFALIINETGVLPDTPTGVTLEQLDSYLLELQKYALKSEIQELTGTKLYRHSLLIHDAQYMTRYTCVIISPSNAPVTISANGFVSFNHPSMESLECGTYTNISLKPHGSYQMGYLDAFTYSVDSDNHLVYTKVTITSALTCDDTITEL